MYNSHISKEEFISIVYDFSSFSALKKSGYLKLILAIFVLWLIFIYLLDLINTERVVFLITLLNLRPCQCLYLFLSLIRFNP